MMDCKCDKSYRMCVTCTYWSGKRQFDGIGLISYDMSDFVGRCNNVGWKGFSGAPMQGNQCCPDYEPWIK